MQDLTSLWNPDFPPDSLRRYAEALNEQARAMFTESGTHIPLMFLFKTEGLVAVLPLIGAEDKAQMVNAVRSHIKGQDIYGIIHITEAWAYLPKQRNDHTFKQIVQGEMAVSDLKGEDKTEVLMLHLSSRDGASRMWLNPIRRDSGRATLAEATTVDQPAQGLFGRWFE